jgi:hypothetical protein
MAERKLGAVFTEGIEAVADVGRLIADSAFILTFGADEQIVLYHGVGRGHASSAAANMKR